MSEYKWTETQLFDKYKRDKLQFTADETIYERVKAQIQEKQGYQYKITNFLMCNICRELVEESSLSLHKKRHPALVEKYIKNPKISAEADAVKNEVLNNKEIPKQKIVYCLIDGRNKCAEIRGLGAQPAVFYIGIGSTDRPKKHFESTRLKRKTAKNDRIRAIWDQEKPVITVQMGSFNMYEAARWEAALINYFRGQLTNKVIPVLDDYQLDKQKNDVLAVSVLNELLSNLNIEGQVGECSKENGWKSKQIVSEIERAGGKDFVPDSVSTLLPNCDQSGSDVEDLN